MFPLIPDVVCLLKQEETLIQEVSSMTIFFGRTCLSASWWQSRFSTCASSIFLLLYDD